MGLELLQSWIIGMKLAMLGVAGAAIAAWQDRKELISRGDMFIFIVAGGLYAQFLTGVTISIFQSLHGNEGGVGFMLGLFGGSLTSAIFRAIKSADLWGFFKTKFGGGS